jgi:hypothetical protein
MRGNIEDDLRAQLQAALDGPALVDVSIQNGDVFPDMAIQLHQDLVQGDQLPPDGVSVGRARTHRPKSPAPIRARWLRSNFSSWGT